MRARNVKPGFFKNEQLAELPCEARLLFIGLWCLADRAGRLEDRPKRIKMEVFPADSFDVEPLLELLASEKLIIRYSADGGNFIEIPTWSKHQRPHHNEVPSRIPENQGDKDFLPRSQALRSDSLIPDSLIPDPLKEEAPPPAGLDQKSWERWEAYRKGIKKPIRDVSREAAMRDMAKLGNQQAEAVEHTVAKGWTGLRLPDPPRGIQPQRKAARTADEIEADERSRGIA